MIQKFETQLKEIQISILGLDNFVVENSDSEFIAIYVYVENLNVHHIFFKETKSTAKISFKIA
ncbi:MAG: phage-related protein [Polaribacter sp.]